VNDKSSADKLRAAATGQSVAKKDAPFPQLLQNYKDQISAALPKHIAPDRMLRIALTAFRGNSRLAECEPKSVFACVVMSAQLGLEVGILGQAYLVPYKQRDGSYICQLIPGWQGMQDLVNRSGRASTWTGAVFEGDEFEYEYGSSPHIHHKPCGEDREEKLTHTYAVGRIKGAEYPVIEVWSKLKIVRHRDHYNKVGNRHYSYENFEQYGRKVPLLQVLKYMPKSVEITVAAGLDYAAQAGSQVIDIKEAIEGNYLPPSDVVEQSADTEMSTAVITGNKKPDAPDLAEVMAAIAQAKTLEDLNTAWQNWVGQYDAAGVSPPIDAEAQVHDRRETFKQAAAKAYTDAKGK
jgi:recombination protein RecT